MVLNVETGANSGAKKWQCQAMNEVDVFSIQNERELYPVGWIHVYISLLPPCFEMFSDLFICSVLAYCKSACFFYRLILLRVVSCHQLICIHITHIRYSSFQVMNF